MDLFKDLKPFITFVGFVLVLILIAALPIDLIFKIIGLAIVAIAAIIVFFFTPGRLLGRGELIEDE